MIHFFISEATKQTKKVSNPAGNESETIHNHNNFGLTCLLPVVIEDALPS
jgi:hypothetical protein